jgi:hypothetical protein
MALGEIETHAGAVGYQVRTSLLRLLDLKKQLLEELESEDLGVLQESQLRAALEDIQSQIAQYKVSGWF